MKEKEIVALENHLATEKANSGKRTFLLNHRRLK